MSNKKYKHLTVEEKKILIERLIIVHPRIEAILDKMNYCREHAKYALESKGILVTGEKGSGKTTIQNIYIANNTIRQTKSRTFAPVLRIRIPVPASERGLTICLLTALGDPYPTRGTITVQTLRVYNLVKKCRTELVIFDEFQHFAERESFKLNRTVSDWTKNFMGETKLPLILFGTPKSKEILDGVENEQLRRRFPYQISLEAFGWNTEKERSEFRKFLQKVEEKLPLDQPSNLADPNTAARIHFATGGLMFDIMGLIRYAATLAVERSLVKINLRLLSESFEENISPNSPRLENPFKA